MKAIVLTCDKYHVLADHMMHVYGQLWPEHPFQFVVPYQVYPQALAEKYGNRIRLVSTPRAIMPTMDRLFEEFDDDEWVYWCIDDKYPIALDPVKIAGIYQWVLDQTDPLLRSVSFCRTRQALNPQTLLTDQPWTTPGGQVLYTKKLDTQPWIHQFLRGRVLKTVFATFPREDFVAKRMDDYYQNRPQVPGQQWLVTAESLITLGESTIGGRLTANCCASLARWGFALPPDFPVTTSVVLRGAPDEQPPGK